MEVNKIMEIVTEYGKSTNQILEITEIWKSMKMLSLTFLKLFTFTQLPVFINFYKFLPFLYFFS